MRDTTPAVAGWTCSSRYRWYVVTVMMSLYACLMADRALLSVLVEPIRAEFGVSDTVMGFVGGVLTAATYALFSIPFGWLSDRVNRRKLLMGCMAGWTLMLPITGMARSVYHLAAAQVMATVGESGCPAAMNSLISDVFSRKNRGLAIALWISGISIGMFFGFALGAYLADVYGWRFAFAAFAVPGIVLVLLLKLTIRETPRGWADGGLHPQTGSPGLREILRFFASQKALRHTAYGLCLSGLAAIGPGYWLPAFLVRSHEVSLGQAGLVVGVIMGITGIVGAPLGGVLMDRLGYRDLRWHAWSASLLLSLSAAPMLLLFLSPVRDIAYGAFFAWTLLGSAASAICIANISNLAAAQYRGLTIALLLVLFTLVGRGLGSQVVGIGSDWIQRTFDTGEDALRYACAAMVLFVFWSAAHFLVAANHVREGHRVAAQLERPET